MKSELQNGDLNGVKIYARNNYMSISRSSTKALIQQIYNIKKMISKATKIPRNDMKRYFEM